MDIKKIAKMLPKLTDNELDQISSKGLNKYFYLHSVSGGEIFIPKTGCIYFVREGSIMVSVFIEDNTEFNMKFSQGEVLGKVDLFQEEGFDGIIKGMPSATLLELPIQELLKKTDIKFIIFIYEKMMTSMSRNILSLFKTYAAKVSYSNEQYFISHLMSEGGSVTYSSTEELALLLHIDIRTLQRIIKKLRSEKLIEKDGKALTVVDIQAAEEMLINY